jgi:signal transduction histidine kinase
MRKAFPARLVLPLVAGILLPLVALVYVERSLDGLEGARRATAAALGAPAAADEALDLLAGAEAAARSAAATGSEAARAAHGAARAAIDERLAALAPLAGAEAEAARALARFEGGVRQRLGELDRAVELARRGGRLAALDSLAAGTARAGELRAAAGALAAEAARQARLGAEREAERIAKVRLAVELLAAFSVALIFLLGLFAWREVGRREQRAQAMLDDRNRLEAAVEKRTAEISELSQHLQTVSESERAQLARDVHDELGSILVACKMDVAWSRARVKDADPATAAKLAGVLGVLDQAIAIKRRVTEALHPTLLDNLGLGAALQWHVNDVCGRAGLAQEVNVPEEEIDLAPRVAVALFRIVQEALTNTAKYARARKVTVSLSRGAAGLALVVADDGVGLPPPSERRETAHGLLGMRERVRALNGELVIKSRPGAGTTIEVFVPLPSVEGARAKAGRPSRPGAPR